MTLSTDTIRTVIEIVPEFELRSHENFGGDGGEWIHHDHISLRLNSFCTSQFALDALAAAAVRVVDEMDRYDVHIIPGLCAILTFYDGHSNAEYAAEGPNRTENTLLAIAEFVKGGFESE